MRLEERGYRLFEHVDPFIGTEATQLPAPQGLAATWWWPKPQVGNTHPGATYPLGMVSAAGSLGTLMAAPFGQVLSEGYGWRIGVAGFVVLSLLLLPAAWFAGSPTLAWETSFSWTAVLSTYLRKSAQAGSGATVVQEKPSPPASMKLLEATL